MKTEKTEKSFEEYISTLNESDKEVITTLDNLLSAEFGEENRSIWEGIFWGGSQQQIIGYGEFDLKKPKNATWYIVGLAIQKNYYSLYFSAVEDNQYLAKKYADELGKVKIGSSSVSFKKLENLNLDTVKKLIKISFNYWENMTK